MPTVLRLLGMRFFYWSSEHKPIHIHVIKGDAEARFVLEPEIEITENFGFKPHELAIAEEVIRDNREYMIEHWKLYFQKTNKL